MRPPSGGFFISTSVSIRARHCCRAMLWRRRVKATREVFQSAPGIAAGRCRQESRVRIQRSSFNPRPALLPGDAYCKGFLIYFLGVSIRARHCCRAMPWPVVGERIPRRVSIRARHCCRAMPCRMFNPPCSTTFQSAPGIAAGRCRPRRATERPRARFNPRPALLPGDAPAPPTIQADPFSFNPRPALLPGDAR